MPLESGRSTNGCDGGWVWVVRLTPNPRFGFWELWHCWWPVMEPTAPSMMRGGVGKAQISKSGKKAWWTQIDWLHNQPGLMSWEISDIIWHQLGISSDIYMWISSRYPQDFVEISVRYFTKYITHNLHLIDNHFPCLVNLWLLCILLPGGLCFCGCLCSFQWVLLLKFLCGLSVKLFMVQSVWYWHSESVGKHLFQLPHIVMGMKIDEILVEVWMLNG